MPSAKPAHPCRGKHFGNGVSSTSRVVVVVVVVVVVGYYYSSCRCCYDCYHHHDHDDADSCSCCSSYSSSFYYRTATLPTGGEFSHLPGSLCANSILSTAGVPTPAHRCNHYSSGCMDSRLAPENHGELSDCSNGLLQQPCAPKLRRPAHP